MARMRLLGHMPCPVLHHNLEAAPKVRKVGEAGGVVRVPDQRAEALHIHELSARVVAKG